MIAELLAGPVPPSFILIAGGLLMPLLPAPLRAAWGVAIPAISLASLIGVPFGIHAAIGAFGETLVFLRLDSLSFAFAVVFHGALLIAAFYAWNARDGLERSATLVYGGAAVGGVLAGDLLTLFVFWEVMALAATLIIWAARTEAAQRAGLRYLAVQLLSGLLLLAAAVLKRQATGSLAFESTTLSAGPWAIALFAAIAIKGMFPLVHAWAPDAYPRATATGTVVLAIFTTKLAIYTLARAFPGEGLLVPIGAAMMTLPILFAVIEDDLRKALCYVLMAELGVMVTTLGLGTPAAINGAVTYAITSILIEMILFMALGAVLVRVGTARASALGGLWRTMPWTTLFALIAAGAVAALPLTSGFLAKGLVLSAAAKAGAPPVWLALIAGSVGLMVAAAFRIPYAAFFAPAEPVGAREAPAPMIFAMALAATLTLAIGVAPDVLITLLPTPVDYAVYTGGHVLSQLQLIVFAGLGFALALRLGLLPAARRARTYDVDWIYREPLPALARAVGRSAGAATRALEATAGAAFARLARGLLAGSLRANLSTGAMVLWVTVILAGTLLVLYASGA